MDSINPMMIGYTRQQELLNLQQSNHPGYLVYASVFPRSTVQYGQGLLVRVE